MWEEINTEMADMKYKDDRTKSRINIEDGYFCRQPVDSLKFGDVSGLGYSGTYLPTACRLPADSLDPYRIEQAILLFFEN